MAGPGDDRAGPVRLQHAGLPAVPPRLQVRHPRRRQEHGKLVPPAVNDELNDVSHDPEVHRQAQPIHPEHFRPVQRHLDFGPCVKRIIPLFLEKHCDKEMVCEYASTIRNHRNTSTTAGMRYILPFFAFHK